MILRRLPVLAALLLLHAFAPPVAAELDEDWLSGQQAFASGDFESALVYLELARDAGHDGVAVQDA